MYQALYGMAPSNYWLNAHVEQASADASAFAKNLTARVSLSSDADLARSVLNNLGITSTTVTADGAYNTLLDALGQAFAAFGPDARGQIILNATTLLANLEGDSIYGVAADQFNRQIVVNLGYASDANHGEAGMVPGAIACPAPSAPQPEVEISAVFDTPCVMASSLQGQRKVVRFTADIAYAGQGDLWLNVVEDQGIVVDGHMATSPRSISVQMTLSDNLPAGTYDSEVKVLACLDEQCNSQVTGSPMRLPLRYVVMPNITIQTPTPMRRKGAEPAPSQTLKVNAPPSVSRFELQVRGDHNAIDVSLVGESLEVKTRQMRAGTYAATVVIYSAMDSRYRQSVDINYVVEAPPAGEQALNVEPRSFDAQLVQGTKSSYRFRVTRPTWTNDWTPLTIVGSPAVKNLRHLGADEYEFDIDTAGLDLDPGTGYCCYSASIPVQAGMTGGSITVSISFTLKSALQLGNPSLGALISAQSSAADLRKSSSVTTPDGAAVRWNASSDQPWLRLLRSSGTTGQDLLEIEFARSVLALPGTEQSAKLSVSIDRPGTLPLVVPVTIQNQLPRFDQASPGVLTSASAHVLIDGRIYDPTGVLKPGVLQVEGARLSNAQLELDQRFVGDRGLLALDLVDIVPGREVAIRAQAGLGSTQLTLKSVSVPRVPSGFVSLPFGAYRPPNYAPGSGALVFAGDNAVWRWAHNGTGWLAPQSNALQGVIDATVTPDEKRIYAVTKGQVHVLEPSSLANLQQSSLLRRFGMDFEFDSNVSFTSKTLSFAANGRALAARTGDKSWWYVSTEVGWLYGCGDNVQSGPDLTNKPCFADPGNTAYGSNDDKPIPGATQARSSNGGTIAVTYPNGAVRSYRSLAQQRVEGRSLPAGTVVVATTDDGALTIGDDGILRANIPKSDSSVDLAKSLPANYVAAGFALAGDGTFAAVYGYRIAEESSGQRARGAALWLLDLRGGINPNGQPVLSQHALTDAVGCTGILALGESCRHRAHVLIAPGDQSAFVAGPRGIAALSLPPMPVMARSAKRFHPIGILKRTTP